jgi:hypothetical protein
MAGDRPSGWGRFEGSERGVPVGPEVERWQDGRQDRDRRREDVGRRRRRIATLGRRAAGVRRRLRDAVVGCGGGAPVRLHRAHGGSRAARHASFSGGPPAGAHREVPRSCRQHEENHRDQMPGAPHTSRMLGVIESVNGEEPARSVESPVAIRGWPPPHPNRPPPRHGVRDGDARVPLGCDRWLLPRT